MAPHDMICLNQFSWATRSHEQRTVESADIEERYPAIVDALLQVPGVTLGSPEKKGFGSDSLKIDGKIFAMLLE